MAVAGDTAGRKARSQHFLRELTKGGKKNPRKPEGDQTLPPHLPRGSTSSCSLGRGGGLPEARAGPLALTSVSAPGAARSASSELRAAVSGPGSGRAGCIAAAASGQPPGALHLTEGRVGPGHRSPGSSRGPGARAWTASPGAGRTRCSARRVSVPPSGCECGRRPPPPPADTRSRAGPGALPYAQAPGSSAPAPAAPAPRSGRAFPGRRWQQRGRGRRGERNGGRGGGGRLRLGAHPAPRPAVTRTELGNNSNSPPRARPPRAAPPLPPPTRPRPGPASPSPGPLHTQTHRQPPERALERARAHTQTGLSSQRRARAHRCTASAHTGKEILHTRVRTTKYTSSGGWIHTCKKDAVTRVMVADAQVHTHSHGHVQGRSSTSARVHTDPSLCVPTDPFLLHTRRAPSATRVFPL